MTPKEGNIIYKFEIFYEHFLATVTKRISNTDALAAANMTLFIRGPSPHVPGVCILFYFLLISISIYLVKRN